VFDDDVRLDGTVSAEGEIWRVTLGDTARAVVREETGNARVWSGRVDGRPVVMGIHRTSQHTALTWRGMRAGVKVRRPRIAELTALMPKMTAADRSRRVVCPMPGLVVSLSVKPGDPVEDGQPLAVIEAMKMENVIRAERAGKVKSVHVSEGESLAVDAVILELE
jgi:propionyl-CoA carboxylase alpha chain